MYVLLSSSYISMDDPLIWGQTLDKKRVFWGVMQTRGLEAFLDGSDSEFCFASIWTDAERTNLGGNYICNMIAYMAIWFNMLFPPKTEAVNFRMSLPKLTPLVLSSSFIFVFQKTMDASTLFLLFQRPLVSQQTGVKWLQGEMFFFSNRQC